MIPKEKISYPIILYFIIQVLIPVITIHLGEALGSDEYVIVDFSDAKEWKLSLGI